MTFKFDALPDYSALQQFARALWRDGTVRGAAVLVGAGFSKNALLPAKDSRQPPLWWDLCDAMVEQLYPGRRDNAPTNPLRIAEEYRTYFGQAALDDFIRSHFPDRTWRPGALHAELLEFPWSDVLTTNWDTLLERTAESIFEKNYDIVKLEADLPHARAPRVVKLHGSIGDAGPLIFAEEDYRTYPSKHAAFVNLARQIFIENELCLIGFSGDDPNFLEWTGWVRDQLGGKARRVYLVGNLDLAPAKRKFLESRNIAPIDFAPALGAIPKTTRHAEATKLFFEALHAARPKVLHNWVPAKSASFPLLQAGQDAYLKAHKDNDFAADLLRKTAALIRSDRVTYPGWLVCPANLRNQMRHRSDEVWLLRASVLERFGVTERAAILREFLWHRTVSYSWIPSQLSEALVTLLDARPGGVDEEVLCEFAVALMRRARLHQNEKDFLKWQEVATQLAFSSGEARMEVTYQKCLFERDQFKLHELASSVSLLESTDPVWMLRRAGLLTEVGFHGQATKLIRDAATELERRYRLDHRSLWIRARLGWAEWVSRGTYEGAFQTSVDAPKAREFKELLVAPRDEIERIETIATEHYAERKLEETGVKPLFEPGQYRESGQVAPDTVDSSAVAAFYQLDQLMEVVGLPIRTSGTNFCADAVVAVAKITYQRTVDWYIWLMRGMHSHYDKSFDVYFSRVAVAQLPDEVSSRLISVVKAGADYWVSRLEASQGKEQADDKKGAIDRLRLHLTVLSRLAVRMSEDEAETTLHYAFSLARRNSMRFHWILEALNELANQSVAGLPPPRQSKLALDIIEFPLALEAQSDVKWWPDVIHRIWNSKPDRSGEDARWRLRIQQLLTAAERGQPSRKEAVHRLSYLSLRGSLRADERASFGDVLWSKVDDLSGLPTDTGLLSSAFADLPSPDAIDPRATVCEVLFQGGQTSSLDAPKLLDTRILDEKRQNILSYVLAAQIGIRPNSQQAQRLFDELVAWDPALVETKDSIGDSWRRDFLDGMRRHVGTVLTELCASALDSTSKTAQRVSALRTWVLKSREWHGLPAMPAFLDTVPDLAGDLTILIRRALVGSHSHRVANGVTALRKWAILIQNGLHVTLPESLIDKLISTIETRHEHGLHALLYTARDFLERDIIPEAWISRLLAALEDLWFESQYIDTEVTSRRAISLSLIRAECVKLAFAMKPRISDDGTLDQWIDAGKSDPLPEVRNVMLDTDP
ncbi:SIR2 family NAD-dependent protein deacylase [Burkholderia plantarii]|uniref:SIR2 family NAD-dependent protein deacylase n=1 Tax=Burkholderia plantarii TaxID=41899 RepID=UPI0018DDCDA3|nr:SIR2 family protein [Burkholderia plantarii]MBI0325550.1 SIR2 family protein [Burkholderia plantarii]